MNRKSERELVEYELRIRREYLASGAGFPETVARDRAVVKALEEWLASQRKKGKQQ